MEYISIKLERRMKNITNWHVLIASAKAIDYNSNTLFSNRYSQGGFDRFFLMTSLCCSRDELAFFQQQRLYKKKVYRTSHLEKSEFTQHINLAMASENKHPEKQSTSTVSDEIILKISKEIVIKFIEVGRVTPATFDETFKNIHTTIKQSADK